MILIALGGNLDSEEHGSPLETQLAAIQRLQDLGVIPVKRSRFYKTAPVPLSDQPWYVNSVIQVETTLAPHQLLQVLQNVEREFGRVRTRNKNDSRLIDLDLIAYNDVIIDSMTIGHLELTVPHPRMDRRAFVLLPLQEINAHWRHPVTGKTLDEMIAHIPADQVAQPIIGQKSAA